MSDFRNKDYIKYTTPLIEVKFTSVKGDQFEASSLDFGGIIISLQTKKSLNSIPGTFNIVTVGKDSFNEFFSEKRTKISGYELFRPSGLVEISINKKQVMIGLIDVFTKTLTMNNKGKPIKSYSISGRDLGSFLIDHKIWYDDIVYKNREKQNTMMGALSSFGPIGNETSGKIMEKVINNWLVDVINKNITINNQEIEPFQFAAQRRGIPEKIQDKFIAMLQDKSTFITNETKTVIQGPGAISNSTYAEEYPINIAMSFVQGSLSSFMQHIVAAPFNEFFVDTGDASINLNSESSSLEMKKNKVYLIFRPSPFDDDNFDIAGPSSRLKMSNLNTFEVDDTIIVQKNLNINKNNKFGVYYVSPQNEIIGFSAGKAYSPATYDESAIRRYGYNVMEVKLGGYEVSKDDSGKVESLVTSFQEKLQSWFARSDEFINGNFTIKGDERLRIGSKLNYVPDELGNIEEEYEEGYYYMTGVSHNWFYGKNYISTINVERGISKKIFRKENQSRPASGDKKISTVKLG